MPNKSLLTKKEANCQAVLVIVCSWKWKENRFRGEGRSLKRHGCDGEGVGEP
jgi:hypothetical protein